MENSKPFIHTGAPGDEQTYQVRQGGLMRCCLLTLAEFYKEPADIMGFEVEGQILPCRHCSSSMIFVEGAWEWNKAKTDYELRG